jgi:hypothetical protein
VTNLLLAGGIISFLLSFVIHRYYIQFIVAAVFLFVLYLLNRNDQKIDDLKKTIESHTELMKQDIDEMKKSQHSECN